MTVTRDGGHPLCGLAEADRVRMLEPPDPTRPVRMVLDTDAYNEIDDQFALAYALLAPERLRLEAVYAAPFHNERSSGPEDGMLKSYEEILRVLECVGTSPDGFVFEGSRSWLPAADAAVPSPAADDLVARAKADDDPLYVVAIGAPTNVASAILAAPEIAGRVVVVWLGGNPTHWHRATEFNVEQDMPASHVLFDSGVPLVHVPCHDVAEQLRTTRAEIDRFVRPAGRLGGYLGRIYAEHVGDDVGRSKVIWDLSAVAYLVDPAWTPSHLEHSPVLTDQGTWSADPRRHLMREMSWIDRDAVFGDLFRRLRTYGE